MRDSAQGLTVYMIYTLIIVVIMLALIWKFLKGDRKKKLQFSGRDFNEYAGALFV